jgi:type III pantothenate kinase
MLLTFDVGNTETTLGLYDGASLHAHWRIMTDVARTSDEFGVLLRGLLAGEDVALPEVSGVAIGSVVPPVTGPLAEACRRWLPSTHVEIIDARSPLPITLQVDEPMTVGADRIINTLAASRKYGRDAIVVDLGTATTFDCINARGEFIGGAIAPGISTAADALLNRAARLFRVELVRPKDAIGRNTVSNVQSGVVYGWAGLVDGIVERMKAEMDGTPRVIATGGHAALIVNVARSIQEVHEHLAFEGLRLMWERANPS